MSNEDPAQIIVHDRAASNAPVQRGISGEPSDPLDEIIGMIDDEPGPIDDLVLSPLSENEAKAWLEGLQEIGKRIYERSQDPRSMVEILTDDRR
jgi:hypothetical protein